MNYRPRRSPVARAAPLDDFIGFHFFASSKSDTLRDNTFYAAVLAGAQAEAAAQGVHLVLHTSHPGQIAQELPKMVRDRTVAGLLLVGIGADDASVLKAFSDYIPHIVLVDNHDPTGRHDSVLSDGAGGAFAATQHLFSLGHRRVGFLLSDSRVKTFRDRLQGYLGAHYEAGIPIDPSLIMPMEGLEDVYAHLTPYLVSPDRPTALLASNDLAASAVMQICRHLSIEIPNALSLIGFDDLGFSSHTFPTLSTVKVDKEALGRTALRLLRTRLRSDTPDANDPPHSLVLPVSLILRQSCRAMATTSP
jgi:LacI family transcriptional regulator